MAGLTSAIFQMKPYPIFCILDNKLDLLTEDNSQIGINPILISDLPIGGKSSISSLLKISLNLCICSTAILYEKSCGIK